MHQIFEIKGFDGSPLYLPNAVTVLSDGRIAVADGGNNRICLFGADGEAISSVGDFGFGRYEFKEPVGIFASPNDELFITDWHNHRIVVLTDSLKYVTEFGHYGDPSTGSTVSDRLRSAWECCKRWSSSGSYIENHFSEESDETDSRHVNKVKRLLYLLNGARYWFFVRSQSPTQGLIELTDPTTAMNKPNGVAFNRETVYVSQKDAQCVSLYERRSGNLKLITHIERPNGQSRFGRLGNVAISKESGNLYVCDERKATVWLCDTDGGFSSKITGDDLGVENFHPFSCAEITSNILAVCGRKSLWMLSISDREILSRTAFGELHGVDYNPWADRLYVADRSTGVIRVLSPECPD